MTDKEIRDSMNKLLTTFESLTIKQAETRREIKNTKTRVLRLKGILKNKTKHTGNTDLSAKGSDLQIRDRVRILNSSIGQQNEGEIVGKTKDNLIKVRTENGKVVRRILRNFKNQRLV